MLFIGTIPNYFTIYLTIFCMYILLTLSAAMFKPLYNSASLTTLCTLLLSGLGGVQILMGASCLWQADIYTWSTEYVVLSHILDFNIGVALHPLSYTFSLLVITIGFATNIYIYNYFLGEGNEPGFVLWINIFVASMLLLVLANNYFTLFLGWELIGVASFFLINFYNKARSVLKCSFKAFSFNLFSDLCLLGALIIFFSIANCSDIQASLVLISSTPGINTAALQFGVLLLFVCASIKSVQIIGHLWLPDSMAAPVPASALIHSATLVSAGVYLMLRFNILLYLTNLTPIIQSIACITAAYGGVVAASQTDMKKLLAYSTMSHCGFLMLLVTFNNFYIVSIYLVLHGLFKAATFFCAGSFIRVFGTQETRYMGSSTQLIPLDSISLIICSANLCGLPLTIGVLYKVYFLQISFFSTLSFVQIGLLFIALLSSSIYFFRLVYYAVFDIAKWRNISSLFTIYFAKNIEKSFLNLTSKNFLLAVLILLAAALVYTPYVYYTVEYLHGVSQGCVQLETQELLNISGIRLLDTLYILYLINFYNIYLIIIITLSLVTWKKNYFFFNKIYSFIILLASLLFI